MELPNVSRGAWRAAIVGVLTVLAAAVRVYGIADESLWMDEGISAWLARGSWGEMFRVFAQERANMALYLVLLKGWTTIFSDGESALRMLSVVFAALSIPAMESLGRRLFSPAAGYLAAAMLAFHQFHVYYSREARAYTLLVLLVIICSSQFVAMLECPARRHRVVYAVMMACAAYAQFMALFAMVAHAVSLLAGSTREGRRRFAAAAGGVLLLVSPLALLMARRDLHRISWINELTLGQVVGLVYQFSPASSLRLLLPVAAIGCVALVASFRRGGPLGGRQAFLWMTVPLALALAISFVQPMFVARYLIIVLPAEILLLAFGATAMPWRLARAVAAAVLLFAFVVGMGRAWSQRKEDWRGAAQIVMANAKSGDAVLAIDPLVYRPWAYYASRSGKPVPDVVFPPRDAYLTFTQIARAGDLLPAGRHRRVWVLAHAGSRWHALRRRELTLAIGSSHHMVRRWRVRLGMVELWERGPAQRRPGG